MTKRPNGDPIPPRSSGHPDRRSLHLNLTGREYELIAERADIAGLSRSRYVREAALAFQLYRTTSPAEPPCAHNPRDSVCPGPRANRRCGPGPLYMASSRGGHG